MTSCKARFLDNNFAENNTSNHTFSSQLAAFPFSNAYNVSRKKVWIPSGNFRIKTGDVIWYNDDGGADKYLNLTAGNYTAAALATHIQTVLNAASSGWTVSYNSTTYKFTITNSNLTYYVRCATNNSDLTPNDLVNGANDTLGVMGFLNSSGSNQNLTLPATGVAVKHSHEYFILDLGTNLPVQNICLIGPVDEVFGVSEDACISIEANNINSFYPNATTEDTIRLTNNTNSSRVDGASASAITVYDNGIFIDLSNFTSDTNYRYWKISIIDRYNIDTLFKLAHVYVGDYTEIASRNISTGFDWVPEDRSDAMESEDGTLYFDTKPIQESIGNIRYELLNETNRKTLMDMFKQLGKTTPFYFQLDPAENISTINELTKYCYFENTPVYNHVIHDYFNASMSIKEVI